MYLLKTEKRSQVTIYLILGIILLFSALFLIYISKITSNARITENQITDTEDSFNSFSSYTNDCLENFAKEGVAQFGNDFEQIKLFLKIKSVECFNESLFPGMDVNITPPFSFDISEGRGEIIFHLTIPTQLSQGGTVMNIDAYQFNIEKPTTEHNSPTTVPIQIEGTDFALLSPSNTGAKAELIPGEAIIHYNSLPENPDEYNSTLLALHVFKRELIFNDSIIDITQFDPELKDTVINLMSDEKIFFDENQISFDRLRENLSHYTFIDTITPNKRSFSQRYTGFNPYPNFRRHSHTQVYQPDDVNDTLYGLQWYLRNYGQFWGSPNADISILGAWSITKGSPNVIIAVIDEGIFSNPDITPNLIDEKSYNLVEGNSDIEPQDYGEYHGTHVAGIIASLANNSFGIAGVCPNCKIISIRVLDENGGADSKTIVNAVLLSVQKGAKIISMSLGGTTYSAYEENIFKSLAAKGIVFVAAAGNDGTTEKNFPAAYDGVISVGATDNTDAITSFSNYGSWVDIYAPGELIISACGQLSYCFLSGTSMATPIVSGVIGLIRSVNASITPEQALGLIQETADPVAGGSGRINAAKALQKVS